MGQLETAVQSQAALMLFEDTHWIDPSTRELLDLIVDRYRRMPALLLITFRPEFQPPWGGRSMSRVSCSIVSVTVMERRLYED